jgi:hypothetical protein
MELWKSYFASRSIWSNIIGLAALVLDIMGFDSIAPEEQEQLLDAVLKLIEVGGFMAGIIFRAIATKKLYMPSLGS